LEQFDVAIVGGGSAGLSALKKLSDLNKSAILIEAGDKIGTKNVSGGILYSKNDPPGRIFNVEDVFGEDFESSAPIERLIKKYYLHATSGNKIFTMDLTPLHEYKTNFGFSVLLNRLIRGLQRELLNQLRNKVGELSRGFTFLIYNG